jgi:hypothetical protein
LGNDVVIGRSDSTYGAGRRSKLSNNHVPTVSDCFVLRTNNAKVEIVERSLAINFVAIFSPILFLPCYGPYYMVWVGRDRGTQPPNKALFCSVYYTNTEYGKKMENMLGESSHPFYSDGLMKYRLFLESLFEFC